MKPSSATAHRYRSDDSWRSRARNRRATVFADGLASSAGRPDSAWRDHLRREYREPTSKSTAEEPVENDG
ncbi:DUF2270 domain-containing protein [Natrinema salifodinae]|uniref:DUF2270 domain-containing protein n=1 Tax=Natrinema salifodinae TaxID=1202768 RepID=UPI001364B87D